MSILGIDHGEKRIGIALSDPSETIARPLTIVRHVSRVEDARYVLELAETHRARRIVVGQSLDEEGRPNLAGRRAGRFAEILRTMTARPIILWDESLSTHDAREFRTAAGVSRKRRASAIDASAAAVMLQSYLESQDRPDGAPPH